MYLNTVEYGSNAYRHQVGGPDLLQQGAGRTQRAGGGRAGGGGERPDAVFARAQPRERPRAPQPRAFTHGGCRGADTQGSATRSAPLPIVTQLQARVAQRGHGDLFPRDAAACDERPSGPSAASSTTNGITTRPWRSTTKTRSMAGATRTARPTARPTISTATG